MSKTCQICSQTARSIIDNTLPICSACTMFIRRNFEKAELLECKSNESCDLRINNLLTKSQQRRLCSSCRMKRSRELGLKIVDGSLIVQHNSEERTLKESPVLPTVSTTHISMATDGWRVNSSLRLLNRSVEFFKRFIEKQLFLSSVHQNTELLPCAVNTPRLLYFDEYALIESRVLMFACETIAEILSDFQNITTEEKKKALLGIALQASLSSKLYFVLQDFPTVGDPRLALFPAYYVDLSNFRPYFRALNDEQYENLHKFIEPFYQRIFRCAERCRRTRPTSVECAALFLLSIYDKLERLQIAEVESTTFQEQLCRELGQHIREQSGSELDAYARLPRLMNCLYAGHEVIESYEDSYSIIGIVLPELRNTDWLEKPKVPESYIEIAKLNAQQMSLRFEMRYLIGLILFVFLSTACAVRLPVPRLGSATSLPYAKKYSQVYIDEFDSSYTRRFPLTYYLNDTYYKDGGPVLFYTGNEGPIEGFVDNTQILLDIAPQLNALVVFAEHRYYGSTLPFGGDSFKDTTKVAYLSVEQALRDYVQVVKDLRANYKKLGKVVAVGGSYGGMLAAWARLTSPHVFDAAWAASAPIAYFRNSGVELGGFHKVLTNALVTFGCNTDAIIKAFADLDHWGTTLKGLLNLNKIFMTDQKSQITSKDDIQSLKYFIRSTFESLGMANYPYSASFLRDNVGAWPLRKACKNLATVQDDPSASVRGLKKALDAYFGSNYATCFKDACDPIDKNLGDLRGWNWQSCTELAISICAQGPPNDVFWPDCYNTTQGNVPSFTSFLKQQCDAINQDISGYQNRMIDFDAVATYFGFDLNGATNIILTNGNLDPWSAGASPNIDGSSGLHSNFASNSRRQDNIYVYNIQYGAHHLDLRAPNTCDPPTVTSARFQIVNILKCWTGQNTDNIDCSRDALQWDLPSWTLPTDPQSDCQYIYGQYPWGQTAGGGSSGSSNSPATGSSPATWTPPSVSPQTTTKQGIAAIVPAISVIISFVFISLAQVVHL